jgi:hypothetical protein
LKVDSVFTLIKEKKMINAKDEFLNEIKGKDLLCCEVATFGKPTRFL